MWWNRKEVKIAEKSETQKVETKPIEKEPTETILYKRIQTLFSKMKYLNHKGYYISGLGKRKFEITNEHNYDEKFCYCQSVNDSYYKVVFTNEDIKIKETKYFNNIFYEVETGKNIFTLSVWKHKTKLEPCPIELTAHEIDLAILEFENYIGKIYKEHKAKIKELERQNA